jgi:hypothetical protein
MRFFKGDSTVFLCLQKAADSSCGLAEPKQFQWYNGLIWIGTMRRSAESATFAHMVNKTILVLLIGLCDIASLLVPYPERGFPHGLR